MSPNQKNVKDGYVRVIQPNGSTSLVSRKSLESAVNRVAKKNAWQTKEQMGLDKFTEDKTPTAYTDIYGYSHVADASTAAQYQNYAERMKQALGNTYTFSGKGNTQETSGIGTSNLYDYTGAQSGGYARNEKGERMNLPLPGAVNFGNKVDSQGRVIQEPWADASTIGASKNYQDVISQLRSKTQPQTQQQTGTQALTGEALIAKIKQGDSTLGESEIQRAQQVYQQAQASGDTERANLAHKWANRIREAMGVSSQYDPVTGAVSANEGDTSIPESTYTGDTGEYDFSGIDNADYGIDNYDYGSLSSGIDYSGENVYSDYDIADSTTGTDTYNYQNYTGTTSAGATTTTDTTTAYSTPEVTDLSATITEMFGNNLQSAIDAIRTKVEEMKSQYDAQLAAVPQQYQASRNQASAEAIMNQRIANEQLANLGLARSGQMLTTQAQTGAAMQNRMAEIDAAQQAAESEIQHDKSLRNVEKNRLRSPRATNRKRRIKQSSNVWGRRSKSSKSKKGKQA